MELGGVVGRLRSVRLLAITGAFGALLSMSGCDEASTPDPPSQAQTGSAASLDARWRDTMTVTPPAVSAGQQVALRFGSQETRGIAFSLSEWDNRGWTKAYYLTSDWGSPDEHTPTWWSVGGSGGWVDIGISGPGPDHVIVPDAAETGEYLLCTENSKEPACALLTVTND